MGGGGTTSTTVQQPTGALPEEAKQGYVAARNWMQGMLENPPVYGGKRVADVAPMQQGFLSQVAGGIGAGPTGVQQAGDVQAERTLRGDYLGGPEMQAAVRSASEPLFQAFTDEVLPGLRGAGLQAGHGGESSRMLGANQNAVEAFSGQLGRSVIAPIVEAERGRQIDTLGKIPGLTGTEIARLGALQGAGGFERSLEQEAIAADREKFEEPLYRQAQAAGALGNAPFLSGGSSTTNSSETPGAMGMMQGIGTLALMAKALSK